MKLTNSIRDSWHLTGEGLLYNRPMLIYSSVTDRPDRHTKATIKLSTITVNRHRKWKKRRKKPETSRSIIFFTLQSKQVNNSNIYRLVWSQKNKDVSIWHSVSISVLLRRRRRGGQRAVAPPLQKIGRKKISGKRRVIFRQLIYAKSVNLAMV